MAKEPTPGLDGTRRQQVASALWEAWRTGGRSAAILTGFPGLGKSERVIHPLLARARAEGRRAVSIDVPQNPTDLDREIVALLATTLDDTGATDLATAIAGQPNAKAALRTLLGNNVLVVLDEFQRFLAPAPAIPLQPFAEHLLGLAKRPPEGGCLWLVGNRAVDPEWSEPFLTLTLEPPDDPADCVRIVLDAMGTAEAGQRFPASRHAELVARLGGNPRALRLLGRLLQDYSLDELVGPPQAPRGDAAAEEWQAVLERSLLDKARQGLGNAANTLLRDLTVLRDAITLPLVDAMGAHLGTPRTLLDQLQARFLVALRGNSREVHPIVREVEAARFPGDTGAFLAAHRRAGDWFAARLPSGAATGTADARLALDLAATRHHLVQAQAPSALRAALRKIRPHIERRFHWTAGPWTSDAERDAQIGLLTLFLESSGNPAVEFQLARRLRDRAGPGDLAAALLHAGRATIGQDHHEPWVLRIQVAHLLHGTAPAEAIAREATASVAANKSRYAVYQLLGSILNLAGRDREAVDASLEGAERSEGSVARLLEAALAFAAAMPGPAELVRVRQWAADRPGFDPQVALAGVLLRERAGEWREGAEAARIARRRYPTYLHLAIHEALCWLGAGEPGEAQLALDAFRSDRKHTVRAGLTWLAAFVAARSGDLPRAAELAALYVDRPAPADASAIEAMLLHEWDHRVGTPGEPNPALMTPMLPPSLTGLPHIVLRPQHGPQVLPRHRAPAMPARTGPRILAVATEWRSGHGGLSTINRHLCCALAAAGADVTCVTIDPSPADIANARTHKVTLVPATRTPGLPDGHALTRRPADLPPDFMPDAIIGHGRVTGPAAKVLTDEHFPSARRLHVVHMAPDEIEWHKPGRDDDAGDRAEARTRVELDLGHTAFRVVAIGPRLHARYQRDLSAYRGVPEPIRLDPGFGSDSPETRRAPPGAPWKILLLGRTEDDALKGLDIAAKAVGRIARNRHPDLPGLELVVRGAPPGTSQDLHTRLVAWAEAPGLQTTVRPFSAETERLEADLRTASILLMPSRSEGFGLVGLEAIVLGTPALISGDSGLGQLLRGKLDQQQASRVVVDMRVPEDELVGVWAQRIEALLHDRDAAFARAAELQAQMAANVTWSAAAQALLGCIAAPGNGP